MFHKIRGKNSFEEIKTEEKKRIYIVRWIKRSSVWYFPQISQGMQFTLDAQHVFTWQAKANNLQ